MKAKIMLAEAATTHPDGTVSMLRAGITHVWATELPFMGFRAAVVLRIETEPAERGHHNIELHCINEDGKDRLPRVQAQMDANPKGGVSTIVLEVQANLQSLGLYQFNVIIDKICCDTWNLKVVKVGEKNHDDPNDNNS